MRFSEHAPSKQWAALKYRGEKMAEVWYKPEGEPFGLAFRIPKESFQISGMVEDLTMENLLKALGIVPEEMESWRHGDVVYAGHTYVEYALPSPPQQVTHLDIHVRLKPPPEAVAREESGALENSAAKRQDFETGWKAILGLEAAMGAARHNMEGLLAEMESLWKRPLSTEDKTYAPRGDVALWSKSKDRVHNAVPKMKDMIHRSVWALGSPERKRLEEVYNAHIQPHIPFPQIDDVLKQFEELRKDRQVLSAHAKAVYQECRGIASELQGALRTLHCNAAHARNKKGATGSKGRFN